MKSKNQNPFLVAAITLAGFAFTAPAAFAATQYYKSTTASNAWTGSFWGASAAGPFTSAWTSGSDANFVDNGGSALAVTGATTEFASINANESVTVTPGGTLGTGGTVASVTVASGKTLNFQGQTLSTAAGTGFTKNGPGIWSLNGSAFTGGFTINAGTVAVGGVNAMGAGGTLTINGGTIRSTAAATARDLSGKYTSITIGGDFTLGDAVNNGLLTFATTSVNLGAANRIITLNSAATFGTSAVISGDSGVGFTKTGSGTLTLQGANTFSGGVTLLSGTLDSRTSTTTLGSGTLVIGGTGGENPIFQTGINNANAVQINANTTGTSIIAANGTGSGFVMSGPITLNGANLNVRTFSVGTTAAVTLSGGVTGTGNLLINNLSNGVSATGKVTLSGSTINNIGTVTSQGNGPTANVISAVIGANVTSVVVPNAATTPLNLAAANLYTGPTTIGTGGTLVLGHANAASNSSSVTIADTGALSLTTTPSTVKTLTLSATGKLNFDVAGGGTDLTVSTSNGVTNSGAAGSVTINITGSAPANGTYTLIGYSGTLQGSGFSAYTLGNTPAGKSYALNDSGSAVQLIVSSAYTWTGAQSSEWSTAAIAGSKNWILDAAPADYTNGIAVIFDDTATNKTVDIMVADVTPQVVLFNSGVYTLQGSNKIAGPAPVTVAAAATLNLGSSNVLPDGAGTGNLTINGILDLKGFSDTINGLSGNGSVDNTAAATTSTLAVGASAGGNFSGSIKNTGGTLALTKTGNTDFTLSGTNTYNGATTVSQNRLFIASSAAFSPNTAVTVNNGASFVLNASGTPAFAQSITLNSVSNLSLRQAATLSNVILPTSGGVIFNNDSVATQAFSLASAVTLGGSLNVQIGGGSGDPGIVTLTGILSGSGGSLVKTGSGQLALGGANTFNGGVIIKNGTLESRTTTTTLGSGTVTMGGSGSSGATYITGQPNSNPFVINAPDSGTVIIGTNGSGSGFTMSGPVTLNGNLTLQTYDNPINGVIKAVTNLTGGVTGTGNLLLNNLGLAANTITIATTTVNHTGSITLQGSATGDTTISASIGSNVNGITQNSATSLMILSGANTYPGNLTVNAGLVRLSNAPDPLNANTGNDASTVTIAATGATLNLTYTGTDKVNKLVIGNTQQANGVYGRVGSGSPIIGIPQITGDGTLTVGAVTPSGFSSWITGTFANGTVPGGQQGPNDDFDKDGISNLVEYAIAGQDPTVGNPAIGTFNAGTLSFSKRLDATGITYDIESSTLLTTGSWTTLLKPPVLESASAISYTFTLGTPVKNFARLKVTQMP